MSTYNIRALISRLMSASSPIVKSRFQKPLTSSYSQCRNLPRRVWRHFAGPRSDPCPTLAASTTRVAASTMRRAFALGIGLTTSMARGAVNPGANMRSLCRAVNSAELMLWKSPCLHQAASRLGASWSNPFAEMVTLAAKRYRGAISENLSAAT